MTLHRLAAAGLVAALSCGTLTSCRGAGDFSPIPTYGTLESQQMTSHQHALLVSGIQSKIKYVFVIFQENHSFDNYFGTYPGAENLGTPLAQSHGYKQYDTIGKRYQTVFKITNPDILGPNQDRYALEAKFDHYKMDHFISAEEKGDLGYGSTAMQARQYGLTTMAVYDCDTLPYLWMYAKNFSLLDHYFQAFTGPSTPGNVQMIAAQTGISEEHLHPSVKVNPKTEIGIPVTGDTDPYMGPYTGSSCSPNCEVPQSYATLPMLFGGAKAASGAKVTGYVGKDLDAVAASKASAIPWMWYQEGFVNSTGTNAQKGYVAHHNAIQYFDYLRQNDAYWSHVSTTEAALSAIDGGTLSSAGGVYYIKGSKDNHFGWKPANKSSSIQSNYKGDDDHPGPGNSDHQVGEAFVATFVNAIAHSKYWNQSAILITWDDDGGFFDHVPPVTFEKCSDGYPCGDGPRIPLLVISPYAQTGSVMHDYADTASIAKFIEMVYGLQPLGSLPLEKSVLPYGPGDVNSAVSDLADAFDLAKLDGEVPPIPAAMAEIPAGDVGKFPPPMNCKTLGITPIAIPTQPPFYNPSLISPAAASRIEATRNAGD